MPLSGFHPAIERWFASRFPEPTEPQRRAWPVIQRGGDVLIAAPTGSGKTFAAFLSAIDGLVRQGLEAGGELRDETQVLYISPLKALSNDVQKNLAEPLAEIRATLAEQGLPDVEVRTLVRTGDTPQADRQAMVKRPPHILVTTPESLYLILTSERAREMLRTVRTVIVDEIHAVARDKRGSHLALSLARLDALTGKRAQRIGLSATQRPIEEIAGFLVGTDKPLPEIVDAGHIRTLDLALEIPSSPLEAVMSAEVWDEVNTRIAELISQHRTTLVFVNTRRLCERLTMHLSERLGADHVTSHHGSLSKERRLEAEERLKRGELQALVATASLELGIDIGSVDLVIQVGSTRSIATLLQRVGRAGHRLGAVPKGRLFPLSRDELIECAALLRSTREGRLDRLIIPPKPLDILAQQIVAASAGEEWSDDALFALVRSAYPYRDLTRQEFDDVVQMLAEGFTTRRGRRGAHIHYDGVNRRLKGRRGARIAAITSGGAIPDLGDYRVILEPTETFVGTLNEDFAIESMPGDIFQLGNTSYQIMKVESGQVRVSDAKGQPPTLPFWVGEAPGRTNELSEEVSRLRQDVADRLSDPAAAIRWLVEAIGLAEPGARQIVEYLAATHAILGVIPTQHCLVLERFFDEAGGMQLVLHAPFGSRINRAWGLALRKRFCRSFNFELQAAATEDAIVLSLGPQHSFPLDDVFHYLNPATAQDLLVQAMLDAPVFGTRWRWNATRALAVLRFRGGRKVPTPLQRMDAEDLVAAVFPDQLACPENLVGDREIPDHPLVNQTIADCLTEAMDFPGLKRVLEGMEAGRFTMVARDTAEPSPLSHEVLNARPYAFLDDAPLEERRTQAVITRRGLDVKTAEEFGTLDQAAIDRVKEEAWPDPTNADELHDALLVMGGIPNAEVGTRNAEWKGQFEQLVGVGRATVMDGRLWLATERVPMVQAAFPESAFEPVVTAPERERTKTWTREDAIRELVRGRLEVIGPTTAADIAADLGLPPGDVDYALATLEHEGFALRGRFSGGGVQGTEWCERRLLARIHRYTLDRLRKEIEPVAAADFLRFLFRWQRLAPASRAEGPEGLAAVLDVLDGYELAAGAWESEVLPARLADYDPLWLDGLCLSGEIAWGRLTPTRNVEPGTRNRKAGPIRSTPIALFRRDRGEVWRAGGGDVDPTALPLSSTGRALLAALDERGASFFGDLVNATGLLRTEVEKGLGELVAWGLVSSDSFAGLRALLVPSDRRRPIGVGGYRRRGRIAPFGVETAGRWARIHARPPMPEEQVAEAIAWQLLRRYGVVFRRVVQREALLAPWRDILRVYRRLEARGEIRGGRFVGGFSGEQYALPEAIGLLRSTRREQGEGDLVAVSGADPLNLVGILTPGDVVPAVTTNRILYRDGVPVAVKEGEGKGEQFLVDAPPEERDVLRAALVRRRPSPLVRAYMGKSRAS
ncbi:MAG TPA: crosslink repair DNA glycosylase YcaQ family protein [Gemmatimonadales bacterium]|nr:crosslink repair DNA glycosylase YcaQ family protein [Gemmatimonadales bacterium]